MKTFGFKSLERSYLKIFRFSALLITLLAAMPFTIGSSVFWDLTWPFRVLVFLGIWLLFVGLFFWYSIHWYKAYHYKLTESGLKIHKGVFWQQQNMVPRNRVQHIDITTGPLERRYDLSKLVVHTAGTRNATITLPGLLQQDAAALRQELINSNQTEDTV
jgi:membrane protein YdbS with pleckstrin-like domain